MIRITALEQIAWCGILCEVDNRQTILFEGMREACEYVRDHQVRDDLQRIAWNHSIHEWAKQADHVRMLMGSNHRMKREYADALVAHWLNEHEERTLA